MVRPYHVMEKPIFTPYVCIRCGVGDSRREWFVDLGFAVEHFVGSDQQAIYLCNECYQNMTLEIGRLVQTFRKDHEKWSGAETPTYTWVEQHDVRESESGNQDTGVGESEGVDATIAIGPDRDHQDSESDDPKPEFADSGDAEPTDDSDPDGSTSFGRITFGER